MNVLAGFSLYLLGAFALVVLSLLNIFPVNYLGGIVIIGFIGGLFYSWLNTWQRGRELSESEGMAMGRAMLHCQTATSMETYPCLKELIERSKEGETCVYSAGCELPPECSKEIEQQVQLQSLYGI